MPDIYQVGRLYHPDRRSWPETIQFNWRSGAYELVAFLADPTPREISSFKHGRAEFALLVAADLPDLLVLLYRFAPAIEWGDAPYSWHLVPADERTLPAPAAVSELHDTLLVVLVDARTGIIQALRFLTWSPAFSTAMRVAIRDQAARPWPGQAEYDRHIAQLYARYPTSAAMLAQARSRTRAGR